MRGTTNGRLLFQAWTAYRVCLECRSESACTDGTITCNLSSQVTVEPHAHQVACILPWMSCWKRLVRQVPLLGQWLKDDASVPAFAHPGANHSALRGLPRGLLRPVPPGTNPTPWCGSPKRRVTRYNWMPLSPCLGLVPSTMIGSCPVHVLVLILIQNVGLTLISTSQQDRSVTLYLSQYQ